MVNKALGNQLNIGQAAAVTTCPPIADENAGLITIGQLAYKGFFELASLPNKPLKHPKENPASEARRRAGKTD